MKLKKTALHEGLSPRGLRVSLLRLYSMFRLTLWLPRSFRQPQSRARSMPARWSSPKKGLMYLPSLGGAVLIRRQHLDQS